MKRVSMALNVVLLALIIAGDLSYMLLGGLALKGTTSFLFLLVGVINLIVALKSKWFDKNKKMFAILLCVGLFFAMLGDIILNIHFICGAALFAIGHVFYFVAYIFLQKIYIWDFVIAAAIFVPSVLFMLLCPIFGFESILMKLVCVFYGAIISLMVGKAIYLAIKQKTLTSLVLAIGSVLFFVSDFMLLLHVFGNVGLWSDIVCLATYYPAQFLLGFSIWVLCFEDKMLLKKTNIQIKQDFQS